MVLYKFRPLHEKNGPCLSELRQRILHIVNGKRLYCAKWETFSDECEGTCFSFKRLTKERMKVLSSLSGKEQEKKIKEYGMLKKLANCRMRVCSLTAGPLDSEDLWREYGDCGRGVAIEFETKQQGLQPPLFRVDYQKQDERGIRNVFEILNAAKGSFERLDEVSLTWKRKRFDIENEVRLMCHPSELEPKQPDSELTDPFDIAMYKCEKLEAGENCYFDFSALLEIKKVWCGIRMKEKDFNFFKDSVIDIPVVRIEQ